MTALDWFMLKIESHFSHDGDLYEVLQITYSLAKEKEKEQIKDAMIHALDVDGHNGGWIAKFIEDYYTKTFEHENND